MQLYLVYGPKHKTEDCEILRNSGTMDEMDGDCLDHHREGSCQSERGELPTSQKQIHGLVYE